MKEVTVQELNALRQNRASHFLLDVREDDELAIAKIEGATHIPMGDIAAHMNELPTDEAIIVMCRSGARSAQVTARLDHFGLDAANLKGGILEWARVIDPSIQTY